MLHAPSGVAVKLTDRLLTADEISDRLGVLAGSPFGKRRREEPIGPRPGPWRRVASFLEGAWLARGARSLRRVAGHIVLAVGLAAESKRAPAVVLALLDGCGDTGGRGMSWRCERLLGSRAWVRRSELPSHGDSDREERNHAHQSDCAEDNGVLAAHVTGASSALPLPHMHLFPAEVPLQTGAFDHDRSGEKT